MQLFAKQNTFITFTFIPFIFIFVLFGAGKLSLVDLNNKLKDEIAIFFSKKPSIYLFMLTGML